MVKQGNKYKISWVLKVLLESILYNDLNNNKMAVKITKTNQSTCK